MDFEEEIEFNVYLAEMQEDILWAQEFAQSWRGENSIKNQFYQNKNLNKKMAKEQTKMYQDDGIEIPF